MNQKSNILNRINSEVLILDGAMGTMLQARADESFCCPELINITQPGLLRDIHRQYINAGSDIILTNTFGASRLKLLEFGLEDKITEINIAAVNAANNAKRSNTLIALSIGPTGKYLEPVGDIGFDAIYNSYKEQLLILKGQDIDIIALESFSDIKEIRAALIAIFDVFSGNVPIFSMMTFAEDLRTVLGTSPESAAVTLRSLGADILGANCSLGPELLLSIIEKFSHISSAPLIVQPNAGMPEIKDGETYYPLNPDNMAAYAKKFIDLGARVIGGCCGTTPAHIKELSKIAKSFLLPEKRDKDKQKSGLFISSRSGIVNVGNGSTKIVGERINPTGKPQFIEELKELKMSTVIDLSKKQVEDGADILDVNVGAPNADEVTLMAKAVMAVQSCVTLPIMIDSQNLEVLEAGLKAADGKVIVNSVTGEEKKLKTVLPLVKKYGASVLGLTLNETGIPKTVDERLLIAEHIIKTAINYGIREEDIIIDCLSLAVSAEQDQAVLTLEAIGKIKKLYTVTTILGISNVSFGLPERRLLNSAFLSMAVMAGLDAAIVNPSDPLLTHVLYAADVLSNKDTNANRYITRVKTKSTVFTQTQKSDKNRLPESDMTGITGNDKDKGVKHEIFTAVLEGNKDKICNLIEEALNSKIKPIEIADTVLIPALKKVGDLFEKKIYFLPQMMLSAEVMQEAFNRLKKEFTGQDERYKGTVVIATVKGDIHDIGKNIVVTLLANYGYKVIDLGKNIDGDEIIKSAMYNNADIIGLSALMTTTMIEMKEIISTLKSKKLSIATMIGGAVVTQKYAQEIGADLYAKDALDAVKKTQELIAKKNR